MSFLEISSRQCRRHRLSMIAAKAVNKNSCRVSRIEVRFRDAFCCCSNYLFRCRVYARKQRKVNFFRRIECFLLNEKNPGYRDISEYFI